jgi:heat shock protein HtpX
MLALLLIVILALVIGVPLVALCLLLGISWVIGLVVAIGIAVGLIAPRLTPGDDEVLRAFDAEPADELRHARLLNLVRGLVLSIGLPEPDVLVAPDDASNAMTVAAGDRVTVLMTQGLIDRLDRLELEAVVAELLVRAKEGDAELGTAAASFIGGLFFEGPLRAFRSFGVNRLRSLFDEDRDLIADRTAVRVTRYPPGLISALGKLRSCETRPAGSNPTSDHLWLVAPPEGLVPSHPLDLRIDVLEEI